MVLNPMRCSPATADAVVAPAHAIVTSTWVKFVTPSICFFAGWAPAAADASATAKAESAEAVAMCMRMVAR